MEPAADVIAQTLDPAGAARRLGCTQPTIRRAIGRGDLRSYPDAEDRPRVLVADVDAYGAGSRIKGRAETAPV